jgi:hypothetical protein
MHMGCSTCIHKHGGTVVLQCGGGKAGQRALSTEVRRRAGPVRTLLGKLPCTWTCRTRQLPLVALPTCRRPLEQLPSFILRQQILRRYSFIEEALAELLLEPCSLLSWDGCKPCCESFRASLQPVTSASLHTVTSMQGDGPRPPCITMGSMHVLMMIHAISIGSHVA